MNRLTLRIMEEEGNIRCYPLSKSVIQEEEVTIMGGMLCLFCRKAVWKTREDSITQDKYLALLSLLRLVAPGVLV